MLRSYRNRTEFILNPFKGLVILLVGLFLCCLCRGAQQKLTIDNAVISVTLHTDDATLSVTDKRTGKIWRQKPITKGTIIQSAATGYGIEMTWRHPGLGMDIKTRLLLDKNLPEFTFELSAKGSPAAAGKLKRSLKFPHPFVTESGTYLVVPMNEGISYPVEDKTISPRRLITYGGHGICMPFWGVTDGRQGHMAIIETPDDAAVRIQRIDGKLCIAPEWDGIRKKEGSATPAGCVMYSSIKAGMSLFVNGIAPMPKRLVY